MKKILLIGGSGIIGRQIANNLSKDYHVIIFDKEETTNCEIVQFDVLDYKKFSEEFNKHNFDAVIHLIGSNSVSDAEKDFVEAFNKSVVSLRNLLSCCPNKTKIIFISSTAVYGNQPIPHSENLLPKPVHLYGLLKYLCEEILMRKCSESKINYTILRLSGVYSIGNTHILIEKLFDAIKNKTKVNLYNLENIRDYVNIEDVILSIKKTIELSESNNQIINVSNGKPYKLKEIVDLFKDFKEDFNFIYKDGSYDSLADITKLKKLYGITPSDNIKEDIERRINEIKKEMS